ncbi:MAG: ATP-dependent RecD-like DNA helicase [Candidatus Hydrogenedentes bacterium]|nr:ATP-dependent RecD-like DNA helicase [Candidatus Hydrogenedentota bacterium]
MVARSHARVLGRIILIAVLASALPLRVNASPFLNGDDALQRYEAALGKGQEAMAKNDAAAIESLGIEAESALAEALEAYRDHYDATGDAGSAQRYIRVLRLKGDHDLAAEIAAETLDSGADSALLWREYGSALLTMGKKKQQEGIDALYESLKRDKTSPEAVKTYNELGFFYLNNAMPVAAASAFDAVLAMDSTDTQGQLGRLVVDVYNGDIGRISQIDAEATELVVDFEGRKVVYDFRELDELVLSYAITIHKSQGSEYPCVVIPLHTQHYVLLQRSLIYTALTRAKKLVIVLGTKKALNLAVTRAESRERTTTLSERLKESV